jgi:hypothetical protein
MARFSRWQRELPTSFMHSITTTKRDRKWWNKLQNLAKMVFVLWL